LPTVLLLAVAELALRVVLHLVPFWGVLVARVPEAIEDWDLFWRLRPNVDAMFPTGKKLRINALGLRDDDEIGEKPAGEYRILSLGESTTYGAHVGFDETYSEVAERMLNQVATNGDGAARGPGTTRYRVINAGVPSYSSFQSLVYLRNHGLRLRPDTVVLYHEGNDYLPCGWGGSGGREETDPELYAQRRRLWWLRPIWSLRIVRMPAYWLFQPGVDRHEEQTVLARFGAPVAGRKPRLTPDQQRHVLRRFRQVCDQAGVRLVLIHPTYRASEAHTCPLAQFAARERVPMLETFGLFATDGRRPAPALFIDPAHPTPEGHRRIGEALARFLRRQPWLPRP
jgi:hypothetical protein